MTNEFLSLYVFATVHRRGLLRSRCRNVASLGLIAETQYMFPDKEKAYSVVPRLPSLRVSRALLWETVHVSAALVLGGGWPAQRRRAVTTETHQSALAYSFKVF